MPLKAHDGSNAIIAPFLADDEWANLCADTRAGRRQLLMPCCGAPCYARVSKLGTRHFVHKRGVHCDTRGETIQHLLAKEHAARGCRDAGYEVDTEVQGDDWIADVLATKDRTRIAFEVQWSSQTLTDTEERQARYQRDGVRGAWFFRKLPPGAAPRRDLPMFELNYPSAGAPLVEDMPLRSFTAALLSGKFKCCDTVAAAPNQLLHLRFVEYECWRCHRACHVYRVDNDGLLSLHGEPIADFGESFREPAEYHPGVLRGVREFQRTTEGRKLLLGQIKRRYSKTQKRSYMSQGCPHCDALFGEWFLSMEPDTWDTHTVAALCVPVDLPQPLSRDVPHWCYSEHGVFCE